MDPLVAALASEQHGVVSHAQLIAAGADRDWIKRQVRRGRLIPLYRGVYAVGHLALTWYSRLMAAVLACGPSAVLSHRTAAMLWGLLQIDEDEPIHLTVTHGHRRPKPGLDLHHAPMTHTERSRRSDLPLAAPLRTLRDLARTGDPHLARAAEQAELSRLANREAMARTPRLRQAIGDQAPTPTRSQAERRLLKLILDAQLPRPETNVRVNGHLVDALWRPHRLVAEFDSWEFHRTRQAFERDRRRDADHLAAGYRTFRITWRQLTREPLALVARLSAAQAATYPQPP